MNICELCFSSTYDFDIGGYGICNDCVKEHPRVVTGLDFEINHMNERQRSPTDSFHWYSFLELYDTTHFKKVETKKSVEEYQEEFKQTVRDLGIKESLTHLLLQNYIGELVVLDRGSTKGDIGVPPRTLEYCICLAASVPPDEESRTNQSSESEWMRYLNEVPVSIEKDTEQRLHFPELAELHSNLRTIFKSAMESYDVPEPGSEEYNAIAAARESELIRGQMAYPEQYIEGMERWYTPFQYEFMEEFDLDMSRSVEWAQKMLDLFYRRRDCVLQQIRWYQVDCFRRLTSSRNFIGGQTNAEIPETDFQELFMRQELESWVQLFYSAKRYLWISKDCLVNIIAPENPHRFLKFLDRISAEVGEYSAGMPKGFNSYEQYPLVRYNNEYLIPNPMHFARSMESTFYHDLLHVTKDGDQTTNLDYANGDLGELTLDLGNTKGYITEKWTSDYLYRIFSEDQLWQDIEADSLDQIDQIAVQDDTAIICEVKSKSLTRKALKGNLDNLYKDFEEGVEHAANQVQKRISQLESASETEIASQFSHFDQYLPIVVVGAQYDRFSTTAYTSVLDESVRIPYVVSIYDLDIITRLLDAESFVDYVEGRIEENESGQIRSMDEMDYLGFYLQGARDGIQGWFSNELENLCEAENVNVQAPIHGADQYVREQLTDLEHEIHLPFLTESER